MVTLPRMAMLRVRPGIVMHHTAGDDSDEADTAEIRAFHMAKGWRDIGYHYVVEWIDTDFFPVVGRPACLDGSHCKGFNSHFGVALVGNFEYQPVPPKQWAAAVKLVADLCVTFEISPGSITGHRDHAATLCPGKNFNTTDFALEVGEMVKELRKQR